MIPVPPSQLGNEVPSSLRPFGTVPTTVDILFYAWRCDRAVRDPQVLPDVALVEFFVRVQPRNQSWVARNSFNFYVLEDFVSSPELGAAVGAFGAKVDSGRFEIQETALPGGGNLQAWKYSSANASIELEFDWPEATGSGFKGTSYFWTGNSDPRRVDRYEDYQYGAGVTGGILRVEGDTRVGRIINGCCQNWEGQPVLRQDQAWLSNETLYR